jgi:hypothetical protein
MQTSSVVLLPLELPNYTPGILIVGGSSADQANSTTPATASTYFLDLSQVSMLRQLVQTAIIHTMSLTLNL